MNITKTEIENLYIVEPKIFGDERGYFFESYSNASLNNLGLDFNFIQDNEASSSKGVLRGLHFQLPPYTQTKLIRVICGAILDVVVDLRKHSKTFGRHYTIELSEKNKLQLLVPKGFAHGYLVKSDNAIVAYKVDEIYKPDFDAGILWNDKVLNIEWDKMENDFIISDKDKKLMTFENFTSPF